LKERKENIDNSSINDTILLYAEKLVTGKQVLPGNVQICKMQISKYEQAGYTVKYKRISKKE